MPQQIIPQSQNNYRRDAVGTLNQAFDMCNDNFTELYVKSDFIDLTSGDDNYIVNAADNSVDTGLTRCTIGGGGSATLPNIIGSATKPGGPGAVAWSSDTGYSTGLEIDVSLICGGYDHIANQIAGTIVGGGHNMLYYHVDGHGFIGGGSYNRIEGGRGTIVAGRENHISGTSSQYGFIGAGFQNEISAGNYGSITGGQANTTSANHAVVAGGKDNIANALYATVIGGEGVNISGNYSAGCGNSNTISGARSFGAGQSNTVDGDYALVHGLDCDTNGFDHLVVTGDNVKPFSSYSSYLGRSQMNEPGDNQVFTVVQSGRFASGSATTLGNEVRLPSGKKSAGTVRVLVTAMRDGSADGNNDADYTTGTWEGTFHFYWDGTSSGFVSDSAGAATPGSDTNRSLTAVDDNLGVTAPVLRLHNGSGVGQLVIRATGQASNTINFNCRLDFSMTLTD